MRKGIEALLVATAYFTSQAQANESDGVNDLGLKDEDATVVNLTDHLFDEAELAEMDQILDLWGFQHDLNDFHDEGKPNQQAIDDWFAAEAVVGGEKDDEESFLGDDTRWSENKRFRGWDYDDVSHEFDAYFAENDISTFTIEDWADFEVEFDRVMTMYEKGLESGIVEDVDDDRFVQYDSDTFGLKDGDRKRPHQGVIDEMYSSLEEQERRRGGKGGKFGKDRDGSQKNQGGKGGKGNKDGEWMTKKGLKGGRDGRREDDDMSQGVKMALAIAVSVLVTSAVCLTFFWCQKRKSDHVVEQSDIESGNEMVAQRTDQPQNHHHPNRSSSISDTSSLPMAVAPQDKNVLDKQNRADFVGQDD